MKKILSFLMISSIVLSALSVTLTEGMEFPTLGTQVRGSEPILSPGVKIQANGEDLKINVDTPALSTFVVDWNNDRKKDLLIGTYSPAYVYVFLNTGTEASPAFGEGTRISAVEEDPYADMGANPVVVDWNNDGKKDLLLGTVYDVLLYVNIGTDASPVFNSSSVIIECDTYTQPFVIDWNNDGKKDLLVGHSNRLDLAYIDLYINEGTDASPRFGDPTRIQADGQDISRSYGSSPFVTDWNDDGKKDLLVRESEGFTYYRNIGTDALPVFAEGTRMYAGGEELYVWGGHGTRLFSVTDWNNDGVKDLVIGDRDGYVFLFLGYTEVQPLYLSLNIEDAAEGVIVNKVVGDLDGPTYYTRVEIVTKLFSFPFGTTDDIPVVLTVSGDLFGAPINTYVRNTSGDDKVSVSYDDLGGGQYRVTTDLSPISILGVIFYRKQIVWRFLIPNDISPQDVTVNAQVQIPCVDPSGTGTVRILAPGSVRTIIVTNRKLLYDNYIDWQVNNLLQRLFTEAQGHPASHTPRAVIYYVERYHALALNWDNTNVDYTSENTANVVANAIDSLIEDWYDDATNYVSICLPLIGCINFPIAGPEYLLIVGDDDTIPFYRYDDPSNDEGINHIDNAPCLHGWCVDSNPPPNVNPPVWATDNDYFFTDNPYADLGGGTDWQTGDIELWVGRLLGETAADMLSLLEEGVSWSNGDTGSVVMASVDGWELGLEPDDGRPNEIADLYDITALFRGKGFQVRNDDIPISEVRTIDVMSPYEGGENSWNTNFRNAANNAGGMDIFFIGGHNSYDHASIPGDDFSPDDTPSDYTRFGVDHPIAMIVGCHGGLPVPDGGGLNGGADNCMVYDLIHEGVSAYIGATGFSYGSPGNLHRCLWGERLMQGFFGQLLLPPGGNSMTIGKAMAEAKNNYVFGFGNKDYYDRKTVTEYNIYGVPWTFIFYPGGESAADSLRSNEEQAFTTLTGPVTQVDDSVYSRTFEVYVDSYKVGTEIQDGIEYHLFTVEGGDVTIGDGAPILPYIEGWRMTMPFNGVVTDVKVVAANSSFIGTYNVPIAQVEPFSAFGIEYTMETDINYPYPTDEDLVRYQETSEGLLFTVFPIQHNPTTDETKFYSYFRIQVTYESPLAVVVTDFATDKAQYASGEEIRTTTTIENVGDVDAVLRATLTINDALGKVVGELMSDDFTVRSGSSYVLPLVWSGMLDDGAYTTQITIESSESPSGDSSTILGGSSTGISVLNGEIAGMTVPDTLDLGEEGIFEVTFANYRDIAVTGQITLTIQDGEGGLVEELTPKPISVPGGLTATATFSWTPIDVSTGSYNAIATAVVEGVAYGPTSQSFQVVSRCGFELYLSAGWNMVSFPCLPDDPSFSNILSDIGYYQVFTWDGTSYVTPDTAEAGRGYWVLVLTDTTVTVADGIPVASYELDLSAGWSMIGSILPCSVDAEYVFPGFYQLLTWDGTSYVTSASIEPGKGYWALVLEPTHITVDESCCQPS